MVDDTTTTNCIRAYDYKRKYVLRDIKDPIARVANGYVFINKSYKKVLESKHDDFRNGTTPTLQQKRTEYKATIKLVLGLSSSRRLEEHQFVTHRTPFPTH